MLFVAVLLALLAVALVGCGATASGQSGYNSAAPQPRGDAALLSESGRNGEELFGMNCAACHGVGAVGTALGPPLVHQIYEPGHHSDHSIRSAVQNGVQSHHWQFGDMAPVVNVSGADVEHIICYIRELQVAEGIADRAAC